MIEVKHRDSEHGRWYNINIDGITIFGCQRKQGEKNGKDYDFISMPARKGADGKYYGHVKLDDDVAEQVLDAVKEYEGENPSTAAGNEGELEPF